jgi:tRNA-uridine 2-sulfurtransferase
VIARDAEANTITVGTKEDVETRSVRVRNAVLHRDGAAIDAVKLRYRSRSVPAAGVVAGAGPVGVGRHGELRIELSEPFAGAAPGQTAVLMAGEAIVGHGTIAV